MILVTYPHCDTGHCLSMSSTVEHDAFTAVGAAFESLGRVVALLDEEMRVVGASPALRGLFTTPDLEGRSITEFLEAGPLIECLRLGRRCDADVRTREGQVMAACGGVLSDRSFGPQARYVVAFELPEAQSISPAQEIERIIRALDAHRWRRSAAARALGISRATLWRRMREFGI